MVNGWFTGTVRFAWVSHPFWPLFYRLYDLTPLLCTVLFLSAAVFVELPGSPGPPFLPPCGPSMGKYLTVTSRACTAAAPPGLTQARAAARSATPAIALAAQVAISGAGRGWIGHQSGPAFCWRPARWKRAGSRNDRLHCPGAVKRQPRAREQPSRQLASRQLRQGCKRCVPLCNTPTMDRARRRARVSPKFLFRAPTCAVYY
jgi:hypothetical protein